MNDRTRALAEAVTSAASQIRALVMQIEALEPGAIKRLDRVMMPKPN